MPLSQDQANAVADALLRSAQRKPAWHWRRLFRRLHPLSAMGGVVGGVLGFGLDNLLFGHLGGFFFIGQLLGVVAMWYVRTRWLD